MNAVAVFALTACQNVPVAQPYQRPQFELPTAMPAVAGAANTADPAQATDWLTWWKSFQDPVLNGLLAEAASQSQDLVLATGRIDEARAVVLQNQANFAPSVDLNASAMRRRASQNSATFNPAASPYSNDRQFGLSASYEIDFWGKYARADDAARARLLSLGASRGAVLSTLYASVAQSYLALRALDAQVLWAEQSLGTRRDNFKLQQRRFQGGVVGEIDLRQAESEVASAEASVQGLRQTRANTESALALLLGRTPAQILKPVIARGTDWAGLVSRASAPGVLPANLPSNLLERRPDLRSAEQALIAANADIAQARTAYFPRLSLTAGLGEQSKDLRSLIDPASLFWNLVGNLTQPIFRAGAIDAVVAASNARQQQALAQYTQAVQNAFRDVHDALVNLDAGRDLAATTQRRIQALRSTLRLAELRYKNGYSNYLEVLNAQRDLTQVESTLVDAQRGQLSAIVSLYKAMGGGWDASAVGQP